MIRPPRYVAVVVATALASLLVICLMAWRVDLFGNEEERRDCERSVAVRDDNRAMWLYLLKGQPVDDEKVVAFRAELLVACPC